MNTRTDELFRYRELAHQKAQIQRSVMLRDLPRLQAATGEGAAEIRASGIRASGIRGSNSDSELEVKLAFQTDPEGDVWAIGTAAGVLSLICQGCAERLEHPLRIEFEVCLADSDRRADELQDRDVMVVEGEGLSLVDLIEDELLLRLPERLCTAVPCERSPLLDYSAVVGKPFHGLEGLRAALKSGAETGSDGESQG